jgi:uncharacterized protein (TIRG00374 family)
MAADCAEPKIIPMINKKIMLSVKVLVSITVLAVVFSQLNLQSIIKAISSARLPMLALAFLIALLLPALNAFKIKLLLPGSSIEYHYILFTNFASNFIKLTVPTDIGAELGRGYYLSKRAGSAAAAFSAIVLDRYTGFCSQVFIVSVVSCIACCTGPTLFWKQVGAVAVVLLFVAVALPVLFCRMPVIPRSGKKGFIRITSGIAQLSEALLTFRTMPLRLGLAGALSIISLCMALFMVITLSSAFHESLHFREASVITFLSTIACFLPSFAGIGFVEGIYAGMFYYFSLHQEIGFTVSLASRIFAIVFALPGVFFIIAESRPRRKPANVSGDTTGP